MFVWRQYHGVLPSPDVERSAKLYTNRDCGVDVFVKRVRDWSLQKAIPSFKTCYSQPAGKDLIAMSSHVGGVWARRDWSLGKG